MLGVKSTPMENLVIGIVFALVGLAFIIFHRAIKSRNDRWNALPFPLGYGKMWTGKYSRGGLIFTYAVIVLFGLVMLTAGIVSIVNAFRH